MKIKNQQGSTYYTIYIRFKIIVEFLLDVKGNIIF